MQFREGLKLALQALWANKLRSVLTLIGMTISVAAVIMVITLVQSTDKYVSTKLTGYGADVFTVSRRPNVIMGPEEWLKYQKRKILHVEDYDAIARSGHFAARLAFTTTRPLLSSPTLTPAPTPTFAASVGQCSHSRISASPRAAR